MHRREFMKILLAYPECPPTFWSNKYLLELFARKVSIPPLGLLTVAALLPDDIEKKVVDLNADELTDEDILWADYVFISAMIAQKESSRSLISRCKKLGVKTVAGGPLFMGLYEDFPDVDHFVLNEAEITLSQFLEDLKTGNPKRIYQTDEYPDIEKTPIPRFDLVNINQYFQLAIQFSRGCPFDCEFCEITKTNGRIPRNKTPEQVIAELDFARKLGWNGRVFFVDDNFIANKKKAKDLLRALANWREQTNFQPLFLTEVPINAADDEELLELLKNAGFYMVFVGIETPSVESLQECGKLQNINRSMLDSIRKFYSHGIKVAGGFIVGFDSDDESIFEKQLNFIQEAGIPLAMIGMLNALPNTKLFNRLKEENRLFGSPEGSNTDFSTNIVPIMGTENLINGYKSLMRSAYSPKNYYQRILNFLKYFKPQIKIDLRKRYLLAGGQTILKLGLFTEGRFYFWRFMLLSLIKYPKSFLWGVDSVVSYVHFHKMYEESLKTA